MFKDSIYDESFQEEFNDAGFYATPKTTKIYLKMRSDSDEIIIGNGVVLAVEHSNGQIPVYSYNSDLYKKYLEGKKIITGLLGLRKTTIDRIVSLIKTEDKNIEIDKKVVAMEDSISELYQLIENNELDINSLDKETKDKITAIIKEKEKEKEELKLGKEKFTREESGFSISESTNDLLYIRQYLNNCNPVIRIEFEGSIVSTIENINDILFTKKEKTISIDKNDIIEIYHFIGNPIPNL